MMILSFLYKRNVELHPDKTAIVFKDRRLTFREFNQRVNRLINALKALGMRKGDRIAILSKNCPEYLEVYGTGEKGGLVVIPLNFRLTGRELSYLINDAQVSTLVVQQGYVDVISPFRSELNTVKNFICLGGKPPGMTNYEELLLSASPEEPDVTIGEDDLCYIIYTSGTTGMPRGAVYTHRIQFDHTTIISLELGLRPSDIYLGVMPLFHSGGKIATLAHFFRGATIVLMEDFLVEEVLKTIQRERITTFQVVPTMIAFMLDFPDIDKYDVSSLHMILYASAPMPVDLLKRGIQKWGKIFFQCYGQTESGPLISVFHKEEHRPEGNPEEIRRLASCGRPAMLVEMRVTDEKGNDVVPGQVGEIIAKSPFLMQEYWNKPELTRETIVNGWLRTGDMATVDEHKYTYIVDRKKDMIISGGENIYPREIEEILYTHPAVLEASVIGVPDDVWGEAVKAILVLKRGMQATEQEITDFCKDRLAGYKKPKSVDFVDSLPKSPSGKVLKRELREKYWVGHARRV